MRKEVNLFITNKRNNKQSVMTCSDLGGRFCVYAYRQDLNNGAVENIINYIATVDEVEQLKACKNFTEARKLLVAFENAYKSSVQNTVDEIGQFSSRVQALLDVCGQMDDVINALLGDNAISDIQSDKSEDIFATTAPTIADKANGATADDRPQPISTINAKPKKRALIAPSGILAPRLGQPIIDTMPIMGRGCKATPFRKKYIKIVAVRAPPCGA